MVGEKHAERGIKHVKRLLPHINIKKNQKYLEIGCGNGHISKYLAGKYNLNVTGTDVDPDMIQLANQDIGELKNIRFMEMDATNIPFKENDFGIVLSFGVLHHISNWQNVLSEISRVLKPEGYFIFGDIAYSRFTASLVKRISKNYGAYTIDDIVQFLKKQNLIIHYEEPRKGSFLSYYSKVFQKR